MFKMIREFAKYHLSDNAMNCWGRESVPIGLCNRRPKACPERGGGNERQRIDGGVASGLLIFPSTPQSPCGDSSPSGEPFGAVYKL